jgi:amidase
MRRLLSLTLAIASCSQPQPPCSVDAHAAIKLPAAAYDVQEKSVATLQRDLAAGRVTSEQLVGIYLDRIAALDRRGPALHSMISLNPRARDDARRLDAERAEGRVRGPLHGIPIVVKDNIETADPLPTTAGSLALADNRSDRDAPAMARLRASGVIVLGKSNLSEWANIRSRHSSSGWSALGGQTKNPYALERNPCGSSSGSGVSVAASLSALALGTETDGSITCPASVLGVVGFKPTLGLVSRTRIIPISAMQDTAGPLARSVSDAALMLQALAGSDPDDPATREADAHRRAYAELLSPDALRGKHLGVLAFYTGYLPQVDALFAAAQQQLTAAGATLHVIETAPDLHAIDERELTVMLTDLRAQLNAYLAAAPTAVATRSLAELIAFDRSEAAREMPYFQQDLFVEAEATAGHDPAAFAQLRADNKEAAAAALDRMLDGEHLDALIAPTTSPAWPTDPVHGDHVLGSATMLPAVAGYPHLSVPMGQVAGLPVGLSFMGRAWSDGALLALGYAYEQRTHLRKKPPLP